MLGKHRYRGNISQTPQKSRISLTGTALPPVSAGKHSLPPSRNRAGCAAFPHSGKQEPCHRTLARLEEHDFIRREPPPFRQKNGRQLSYGQGSGNLSRHHAFREGMGQHRNGHSIPRNSVFSSAPRCNNSLWKKPEAPWKHNAEALPPFGLLRHALSPFSRTNMDVLEQSRLKSPSSCSRSSSRRSENISPHKKTQ